MDRGKKVIFYFLFIMMAGLALGIIYFFDPSRVGIFPSCTFHDLTGFYCPSCGLTRATHSLLHFRFLDALRQNIFILFLIGLFIFGNFYLFAYVFLEKAQCFKIRLSSSFALYFIIFTILYTVLRNIPGYPFYYLAP